MSDTKDPNVQPEWLRDRYAGLGGTYVYVDDERFPADEAGRPLPHTRNPDGTPIVREPVAPADEPAAPVPGEAQGVIDG